MISLAAVMSKLASLGTPCPGPPRPITIRRNARSFMSITRFHRTFLGSSRVPPKCSRLSIAAASRLWALVMAWKSPVNWRLIASDGSTRLAPPPVAPPLRPKTGPIEGCRNARHASFPILRSPWASPIEVVVFPSPAGVGVIAETRISLPAGRRPWAASIASRLDLRLVTSIRLHMLESNTQVAGHLGDGSEGKFGHIRLTRLLRIFTYLGVAMPLAPTDESVPLPLDRLRFVRNNYGLGNSSPSGSKYRSK